jgi:hypothetical protein
MYKRFILLPTRPSQRETSRLPNPTKVASKVWEVVTGKQVAGRGLTVFSDDVFLVSYPRSGNTWTRFLLGNLIYQDEPVTFANIESRIPEIYFNPDHKMRKLPRPRIISCVIRGTLRCLFTITT